MAQSTKGSQYIALLHLLYISFAIAAGGVLQHFPQGIIKQPLEMLLISRPLEP